MSRDVRRDIFLSGVSDHGVYLALSQGRTHGALPVAVGRFGATSLRISAVAVEDRRAAASLCLAALAPAAAE